MKQTSRFSKLLGGTFLVSGSCIGAAMLGLPVITGEAGFYPSLAMYVLAWLFMFTTGLLFVEVNLWFSDDVSIVTMARKTLGRWGGIISWVLYCLLFYCLLVAFIAGSGPLVKSLMPFAFKYFDGTFIPSTFFTFLFGSVVYLGASAVDWINRIFMFGLLSTYLFLVFVGIDEVDFSYFERSSWSAAPLVLPAMVVSFGYHNLIPTMTRYFDHDKTILTRSCFYGTLLTVFIYFIWQFVVLGIVPYEGANGLSDAFLRGDSVPVVLERVLNESIVTTLSLYFAFYALVTTFLGIGIGFVDFLADGLQVSKTPSMKKALCLGVFLPPYLISFVNPGVFLKALSLAGGFGAVAIFGVLPVLMVWKGRYRLGFEESRILPGGKTGLAFIMAGAIFIILTEFYLLFS